MRHDATVAQLELSERMERLTPALCRRPRVEEKLLADSRLRTRLVRVAEHDDIRIGKSTMESRFTPFARTGIVHHRDVDTFENDWAHKR